MQHAHQPQTSCSNRTNRLHRPWLSLLLAFALPAAADPPSPDPQPVIPLEHWNEEDRREMVSGQLLNPFEPVGGYFFVGDRFPRIRWQQPWLAALVWPPPLPEPQVRWFNAQGEPVESPEGFGRHTAVAEATLADGRTIRRGLCLFRVNPEGTAAGADRFPFQADELPAFGLAPELWERERENFTEFVRQATFDRLIRKPEGAVLLAALAEASAELRQQQGAEPTTPPVRPDDRHRLHVMTVRGQLDGEEEPPRAPLARPRPSPHTAATLGEDEEAPALAGYRDEVVPALDDFCQEWLRHAGLPFTIAVARRGHVLFHRSYGDWHDAPVTPDTSYPLFSISKSVMGVMTALFLDAGLLHLDDPLAAALPGLDKPAPDAATPSITVRRCLMHVSGLTGHSDWGGLGNPWLDEVIGDAIAVGHVRPGHQYSGTAYDLVGLAMEHRTGETLGDLFDRHLFEPLTMTNARMVDPGAGIHLRAIDLARLGQLLLGRGRYGGHEFFSPETFEQLLPESYAERFPELNSGDRADYGLGIYWRTEQGQGAHADTPLPSARTLGHGSFSGSLFRVDLEHDLVIAMGRFQSGPDHGDFVRRLLELLIDHMQPE